jgi:hypothetical protein
MTREQADYYMVCEKFVAPPAAVNLFGRQPTM